MVERLKPRLVEGPICKVCDRALDIVETKTSDGASVKFYHRDGTGFDREHKPQVTYRVLRP